MGMTCAEYRQGHPSRDEAARAHEARCAECRALARSWDLLADYPAIEPPAGYVQAVRRKLAPAILRFAAGKDPEPTAVILDSRTVQSTPESGGRAGYDGYKRRKGSKVHAAVDTLGHLLALHVTAANEQDRAQVAVLAEAVQEATLHVLEALGPDGLDPTRRTAAHEPLNWDGFTTSWFERYLRSFPGTIAGGTSQIQRNIVAERVLGLPRS